VRGCSRRIVSGVRSGRGMATIPAFLPIWPGDRQAFETLLNQQQPLSAPCSASLTYSASS